jgi:hypothetical protein
LVRRPRATTVVTHFRRYNKERKIAAVVIEQDTKTSLQTGQAKQTEVLQPKQAFAEGDDSESSPSLPDFKDWIWAH